MFTKKKISTVILFFTLVLLYTTIATAVDKTYGNLYNVSFVSNYDGDTVKIIIPYVHPVLGDNVNIRIYGIDTPEIRGSKCYNEKILAIRAKDYVYSILSTARKIHLLNIRRGKYFRIVATVSTDKGNMGDMLLAKGYAVEYFGGTKTKNWCE